jgi:tetratricopeptide (TPR) repeat protein
MKTHLLSIFLVLATVVAAFLSGWTAFAGGTNNLHLATPGSSWSLEINTTGFALQGQDFSRDGTAAQLQAVNTSNNIILSAFLEKPETPGDAKACRDFYWSKAKQNPMKMEDVKMSEISSVALVEYTIKGFEGMDFNQKNMNAYLSQNGYWVDVHISKMDFKPKDEAAFLSIVKSIRFNEHHQPTVLELAAWGTFFMSRKNYAEGARCYEQAMELDKSSHSLNRELRVFVLLDLISCHGNLGHKQKAKELSELGLQKEPGYPMFYYDLACAFAEIGDKEKALQNLRLAFQNKSRLFTGDTMADPKTDDSFSKYSEDPEFIKFYAEMDK